MSYVRANIDAMSGYIYGDQPEDPDAVKLNTNENPYPPSPEIKRALAAINPAELRKYPDPTANHCRQLLAQKFRIDPKQIVITNGGDEAIRLVVTTFMDPGGTLATTDPSYSVYSVVAKVQDCKILEIPVPLHGYGIECLLSASKTGGSKLFCLVNPHAPTGYLLTIRELRELAEGIDGLLLIDEAYVDFVDPMLTYNSISLVNDCDNVLILRTLSKGYSLAGLRFGWLMGDAKLVEPIVAKSRDSFNVDSIAQKVAAVALADERHATTTHEHVRKERTRLYKALQALQLDVLPSQANFLLVRLGNRTLAKNTYEELRARNVYIRYFDRNRLDECLRITVGTPKQNDILLHNLATILRS